MAGRATVLTEEAELLFGVTAGEAGGITAVFPLLAPLAPLAAPAETETVNIRLTVAIRGQSFKEDTYSNIKTAHLFWLPCTCRSCLRSHPPFCSSPQPLHHHHRRRHWTTTPHPRPTTAHLYDIYRGKNCFMKYSYGQKKVMGKKIPSHMGEHWDKKVTALSWSVYSPVESLTLPVFFLLIPAFQALKSLDVLNGFKCFVEVIHNVSYERLNVLLEREDMVENDKQSTFSATCTRSILINTFH